MDCHCSQAENSVTVGVIDIGTNTVLLLIARQDEGGQIETIIDLQRTPRLGKDVDARRVLGRDAIDRVLGVLSEYRPLLDQHRVERIVVAATSAVRDAANRETFCNMVLKAIGREVEVLSGDEEGRWTFLGALSGLTGVQNATVIDIGGGSTEVTSGTPEGINHAISLDLGAVRLTERFLRHSPPLADELREMDSWLHGQLAVLTSHSPGTQLIGVAGTATSLAVLDRGLPAFDRNAVAGHMLSLARIETLYKELRMRSALEIRGMSQVMEGREDIITAGTAILLSIMGRLGAGALTVSERGIRYGLALRELKGIK